MQRFDAAQLNHARILGMALVACSAVAVAAAGGGAAATGLAAVALISPLQWGLLLLSVLLSGYLGSRCLFEAQRTMHASSAQPFLAPQPLFAALWAPPPFVWLIDPCTL